MKGVKWKHMCTFVHTHKMVPKSYECVFIKKRFVQVRKFVSQIPSTFLFILLVDGIPQCSSIKVVCPES